MVDDKQVDNVVKIVTVTLFFANHHLVASVEQCPRHGRPPRSSSRKKELGRLALICSAWTAYIRSLLFRRVYIADSNVVAGRFLSLLRRNNHLGHYTTILVMQSAAALEFPDLPNFLPNLRTAIISSSVFEPIEGSVRPWVGVTHLKMKFCMLSTAEDLWRLLCIFPALEHLHLSGWLVMDPDAPIVIATNAPAIHLKELVLLSSRHHSPHPAAAQLALHDLTVDRLSDWDASACNSLLCKIGPMLQELELVVDLPEERISEVGICIRPCTALRSLTLGLYSIAGSTQTMRGSNLIISILDQIFAPTLTTLTFNVSSESLTVPLRELPWDEIEDSILGCLGPHLERVVIRNLPANGSDLRFDEFAGFLKERLVSLERSHLLQFERGGI
ncbi:hypothetical protein B0H14DRAFT_2927884 [Mycena olivaceomarginata]|nr:hypothetical protein B0H14DRAFT_2927884 [Mycena olivaceomarginata]